MRVNLSINPVMPMPPNSQPLDIVTVAVALAALMFGRDVAAVVGPYSVIVLGAVLGGAWSASRRPPTSKLGTLLYMMAVVTLSLLITVPMAEIAAVYTRTTDPRVLFGPVSALISGVGDKWPVLISQAWEIGRNVVARKYGGPPPNEPPQGGAP
jgi:hypothetical protein